MGWSEVRISCSPEQIVTARGGFQAKHQQYALKHIRAMTINKSQGDTIPTGLAVQITTDYCPWEKLR